MDFGRLFYHLSSSIIVLMLNSCFLVGPHESVTSAQCRGNFDDSGRLENGFETTTYQDSKDCLRKSEDESTIHHLDDENDIEELLNGSSISNFISRASHYIVEATAEVFSKAIRRGSASSKSEDKTSQNPNSQSDSELENPREMTTKDDEADASDAESGNLISKEGSSVWCSGRDHTDRLCRFRNLCYFPNHDEYVFLHGAQTLIHGVPQDRFNPSLLDASSVKDHNMQYFNYIDLPASVISTSKIHYITTPTLMYRRFNPENIMHVFHDDLLPMWATLRMLDRRLYNHSNNMTHEGLSRPFDVGLVFLEGWSPGDYSGLYSLFTSFDMTFKSNLTRRKYPSCYRDAYVGVLKSTTWYQYGFLEPQGPIKGHEVTGHMIHQFTHYIKANLVEKKEHTNQGLLGNYIVILTRKRNRLILNEVELSMALMKEFSVKVISLGIETHSVSEMIHLISRARILLAMHGSLLALSMFLPLNAIVIELFPFAVNPSNYTPYRTLANLKDMGLLYRAWRNMEPSRSVTHPDRPWDIGGISHLEQTQRDHIDQSHEVPKHLCCRDAEWLYRIYQDTIVDIPAIIKLIHDAQTSLMTHGQTLKEQDGTLSKKASADHTTPDVAMREKHVLVKDTGLYPAAVRNLTCIDSKDPRLRLSDIDPLGIDSVPGLGVAWLEPWNVQYFSTKRIKYEVWIQEKGRQDYAAWILARTSYYFTVALNPQTSYNIWIRCIVQDTFAGPFNEERLSCST